MAFADPLVKGGGGSLVAKIVITLGALLLVRDPS